MLSRFAGAALELDGAILVNPYDPDEIAEAMHEALVMGLEERRWRWRGSAEAVRSNTAAVWAGRFLDELEERPARAA